MNIIWDFGVILSSCFNFKTLITKLFPIREQTCEPKPNVVEWALSGDYDPTAAVLIDACHPQRTLSKEQVTHLVTRLAGAFQPGSVVCVHLPNDILYPVLVLSILAAGCRWTGTNISYKESELDHHLRVSQSNYVVTSVEYMDSMEAVIEKLDIDVEIILFSDILQVSNEPLMKNLRHRTLHDLLNLDVPSTNLMPLEERLRHITSRTPASLMSTSGTTGLPKMAERTHGALVAESKSDELYDADTAYTIRRLFCTPVFHAYSFPKMVINPLRQGYPTYYTTRFDDTFAHKISQFGITDIITVPPILARLVQQVQNGMINRETLNSLRTVLCAGAPLTEALRGEFLALLDSRAVLAQEWGMTECGCITRMPRGEDQAAIPGSVGHIVGGYQVTVDTSSQIRMADGRLVGELLAKGPQLMTAYLDNLDASTHAFAPGGWYRTGDVGYLDGNTDGGVYVYVVDRVKDIIKTNGWQISPAELETVALRCPGIKDACAVSAGHGLDEHPRIFAVRANKDITEQGIRECLGLHLSRYKISKCDVCFVDRLPRAPSGKLLKRVLRTETEKESEP